MKPKTTDSFLLILRWWCFFLYKYTDSIRSDSSYASSILSSWCAVTFRKLVKCFKILKETGKYITGLRISFTSQLRLYHFTSHVNSPWLTTGNCLLTRALCSRTYTWRYTQVYIIVHALKLAMAFLFINI